MATSLAPDEAGRDEWRFEDNVQRKIVGTSLLVVCIVGTIGNTLVIVAVSLTRKLQNVTNIFVTNLAVGDLLHCVILPFMVHDLYQPLAILTPDPVVCKINGALTVLFLSVSVFSHALIAITRYVMITRPRRACQTLFTTGRITIIILTIWVVSSVDPVLSMAGLAPLGYNPKYGICSRDIRYLSSVVLSSVRSVYTNLLSVVVVLFCYVKIFIYIRRHNDSALRRILTSSSASGSLASKNTAEGCTEDEKDPFGVYVQGKESDKCIITVKGIETKTKKNGELVVQSKEGNIQTISSTNVNSSDQDLAGTSSRLGKNISRIAVAPVDDVFVATPGYLETTSSNCYQPPKRTKSVSYSFNEAEREDRPYCRSESTYSNGGNSHTLGNTITNENLSAIVLNQFPSEEVSDSKTDIIPSYSEQKDCKVDQNSNRTKQRSWRWRSQKSQERPTNKRKEIDITKKLFIVVCVFFACISPYVFFVSLKGLERLLPYAALLLASSSCLNPVIYGLAHPQFQKIFLLIVSCHMSNIPKKTRLLKWLIKEKTASRGNVVV